jgi:hypothetical protein
MNEQELNELKKDKERLDWLSTDEGNQWAYYYTQSIIGEQKINRESIDEARK